MESYPPLILKCICKNQKMYLLGRMLLSFAVGKNSCEILFWDMYLFKFMIICLNFEMYFQKLYLLGRKLLSFAVGKNGCETDCSQGCLCSHGKSHREKRSLQNWNLD